MSTKSLLTKEILDTYYLVIDNSSVEFKINVVPKDKSCVSIGTIKVVHGRWRLSSDSELETSDLEKAIVRCIEVYLRFKKEFDEVNLKFST